MSDSEKIQAAVKAILEALDKGDQARSHDGLAFFERTSSEIEYHVGLLSSLRYLDYDKFIERLKRKINEIPSVF